MNKARVWAVMLRHLYYFKHSWERWTDAFYWPAVDILLWGLTSVYIREIANSVPNLVLVILTGLVFWQVVWRSQYEITVNLLEEMWNQNMVNLFSTPLKISEWMMGLAVVGVAKMVLTAGFAFFLVFALYKVNVFQVGWLFLPMMMMLLMSGWYIGFFVAGLLIRWGKNIQTMAWAGVYLLAPFSAIYYPVSSLPEWAQKVASFIPTSYLFEGMRSMLLTGTVDQSGLLKSAGLIFGYLILSIGFFFMMFNQSKKQGLASLE